jgi:DNA-binding transcriptional MerR regulator
VSEAQEHAERRLSIGEAAAIVGYSIKTLQRWDQPGKKGEPPILEAHRTPGGRRYYLRAQLDALRVTDEQAA